MLHVVDATYKNLRSCRQLLCGTWSVCRREQGFGLANSYALTGRKVRGYAEEGCTCQGHSCNLGEGKAVRPVIGAPLNKLS